MEGFEGSAFNSVGSTVRKKRSNMPRRPRSDQNTGYDSSTWCSDQKKDSSTWCALSVSSVNIVEGEANFKRSSKDDGNGASREFGGLAGNSGLMGSIEQGGSGSDFKRCSEGALAPANWKSTSNVKEKHEQDGHMGSRRESESWSSWHSRVNSDTLGNENKLRKVKLKVGGVTHTIHAKSTSDGASGGRSSSMKSSQTMDASRPRKKLILQDTSDDDHSPSDKISGSRGVHWKDFSGGGSRTKTHEDSVSEKQTDKSEPVRKSKRVPKRPLLDEAFDDGNEDEEIRYLERLRTSKVLPDYARESDDDGEEGSKKQRRISRVLKCRAVDDEYDEDVEYGLSKLGKDSNKNSRSETVSEETDYVDEEEPASDGELEAKRKNQKKESVESLMEGKKEVSLTTRQRALQSGKEISTGSGASLIEFPNGLPPTPPRKQKEKLSEVEQQLKKAEAAQRRRMQAEKAARESEAEAIRKILGQDSSRKKREDKMKKRRDELAQERASNALALSSNTVRWVIGPTGTTVIFPKDIGLPNIFDSRPCSYPPPRAKCAGPSCTNTYKYRDSKSNLPLCSLQCYRAIHEQMPPVSTC
ncbi:INO80 complex subunit B-like conserved region [Macleaya cordata]|uniref:INO80 complex subunit B-like conserved region n=1 Tax=Macleaya cordata TaxID=56857 RepID=A0A200R234_MACCD|nr:INO80 complex subunit B-like conserved region [Macleaya cordata]